MTGIGEKESRTRSKTKRLGVRNGKGQVIGQVIGSTFVKYVRGSKHMLRKPPAWAFDVCVLERVEALGATVVNVCDEETNIVYSASLADVWHEGKQFNRGYGEQVFLPLEKWATQRSPTPPAGPNPIGQTSLRPAWGD